MTTVSGGQTYNVSAFQNDQNDIVLAGGTLNVLADATTELTTNAGIMEVEADGVAYDTTVNGGGILYVDPGGSAQYVTINSGGSELVYSGGETQNPTINSGGTAVVYGTLDAAWINGGTLDLAAGASVNYGPEFTGPGGVLRLDGDLISVAIRGFAPSDTIQTQLIFDSHGFALLQSNNVLLVFEKNQQHHLYFDPAQNFTGEYFHLRNRFGATDVVVGQRHQAGHSDFLGNGTSDILFRNDTSGDTWFEAMSNGAPAGWNQIGGSDTRYSAVGVGEFYGTATSDIVYRNASTGDTWIEQISNGAPAGPNAWHQIGGSDTHFSVAGIGDFFGDGTNDILFRNNSTGDTWFEAISNGAFNGWHQIGGSDTHYAAVGVGDFFGNGTSDILFRNNSTGDTWIEQINNGASAGWMQVGGSDTHYSVVGVGDFDGNGFSDILFRNNTTGDTWFEAVNAPGWHQVGGSDTNYAVVGIGDYFDNGTSDILFRNNSGVGATWFEAMSNGASAGWYQIGGSDTRYTVKT